jgi:hypothetical protein
VITHELEERNIYKMIGYRTQFSAIAGPVAIEVQPHMIVLLDFPLSKI